jgi:hypothetical protein
MGEQDAVSSTCCPQTSFRVSKAIPVIVEGMTSRTFYTIYKSALLRSSESEVIVPRQIADGKYCAIHNFGEVG